MLERRPQVDDTVVTKTFSGGTRWPVVRLPGALLNASEQVVYGCGSMLVSGTSGGVEGEHVEHEGFGDTLASGARLAELEASAEQVAERVRPGCRTHALRVKSIQQKVHEHGRVLTHVAGWEEALDAGC